MGMAVFEYVTTGDRVPRDLSTTDIRAFVRESGGFVSYPAVMGTEVGQFTIAAVTDGTLLLRYSKDEGPVVWREHDAHDVELVSYVLGRPDAVSPQLPTPLILQLTGLEPWQTTDTLYVNCWENGTESSGLQSLVSPSLVPNATSVDSRFDWNAHAGAYSFGPSGRPYLTSMESGDMLSISKLSTEQIGDVAVETLTQNLAGPAPTQVDGEPSVFSGSFVSVPRQESVRLIADLPSIARQFRGGTTGTWSMLVMRGPGVRHGLLMGPPLLGVYGKSFEQALDLTRTFGDPFDTSWPRVIFWGSRMKRIIALPGGQTLELMERITTAQPLETIDYQPTPLFGLSAKASLNGVAIGEGTRVRWNGSAPITLAVEIPDLATGFDAWLLAVGDGVTRAEARFVARSDRLMLPAEAFTPGTIYVLVVTVSGSAYDMTTTTDSIVGPFVLSP